MGKGLPKKYAKMGFAKGWKAYKASKAGKKKTTTKKSKKGKARRRSTVRRRKKYRKRKTRTIPVAVVGGFAAGFVVPSGFGHQAPATYITRGDWSGALKSWFTTMTGYSAWTGKWDLKEAHGLHALIIGALIHKGAGWLGLNKHFANLPAPLNKLRI